jgi:hypothetical protein
VRFLGAALLAGASVACLWFAWNSFGIEGAYFSERVTSRSLAGEAGPTLTTALWVLGAAASMVAAVVVARRTLRS